MKKRCAYMRVSSDDQDCQRQRQILEPFAPDLWFEDHAPRDKAESRESFQQLIEAVKRGEVSEIIVAAQDRWGTKDSLEFGYYGHILRANDCRLIEASGRELNSDDDVAVLHSTLGAITSKREQEVKSERSVSARIKTVRAYRFCGGRPVPGIAIEATRNGQVVYVVLYRRGNERIKLLPSGERQVYPSGRVGHDPDLTLRPVPDPDLEARQTILNTFQWAADGMTLTQIAARLADSPFFRSSPTKSGLRDLLSNPAYVGKPIANRNRAARFREFTNGKIQPVQKGAPSRRDPADWIQPDEPLYEPIIPIELWEKVQARRKKGEKRGRASKSDSGALFLRRLLYCARCNRQMQTLYSRKGRGIPGYVCSNYREFGRENATGCRHHHAHHDDVLATLKRWLQIATEHPLEMTPVELLRLRAVELMHDMSEVEEQEGEKYDTVIERRLAALAAQIEEKEQALRQKMAAYAALPAALRQYATDEMSRLHEEIERLRSQAVDLRRPLAETFDQIARLESALIEARNKMDRDAIFAAIERIDLHFDHIGPKRSVLRELTVHVRNAPLGLSVLNVDRRQTIVHSPSRRTNSTGGVLIPK